MSLLALDTATEVCSVALCHQGKIYHQEDYQPREHHRLIFQLIDRLLAAAQLQLTEVDQFAVNVGPGSFIGVRLGVATVQGLAIGLKAQVIPIISLQLIAQKMWRERGYERIIVANDAHRGNAYVGYYQLKEGILAPETEAMLIPLTQLTSPEGWVRAGSAWALVQLNAEPVQSSAYDMLALASHSKPLAPEALTPLYLNDLHNWREA